MSLRKNSFIREFLTQRGISGAQSLEKMVEVWTANPLPALGSIAFVMVLAAGIRLRD